MGYYDVRHTLKTNKDIYNELIEQAQAKIDCLEKQIDSIDKSDTKYWIINEYTKAKGEKKDFDFNAFNAVERNEDDFKRLVDELKYYKSFKDYHKGMMLEVNTINT